MKTIRFRMRFAAANSSIFDGEIRLDARGGGADALIAYSHWDDGEDPDSCTVHVADEALSARAGTSAELDAFRCTFPLSYLNPDHRVHRRIVHGSQGTTYDRAPDLGWYI